MAKKQTRRSISVSRTTYERLKAFCETNNISMSQFVESRVGDFLGEGASSATVVVPAHPRPVVPAPAPSRPMTPPQGTKTAPASVTPLSTMTSTSTSSSTMTTTAPQKPAAPVPPPAPMTSAAARYAIEPPPPIIKRQEQPAAAPKPAEKRPDQIFTF